ncbi:MAG: Alpha/beta hydrolase fold protein [Ramlibacter sp.]|jgi:2-hydroxymuconate-semialdehyde hydrolase|nr:Alpha/beta hydrolase fold protein [Ramlibacter sp.]
MTLSKQHWAFEGHEINIYTGGSGPTLLLFHGVGPGTSIPANFSAVTDALTPHFRVVGMDLVGFGLSSRKEADPYFDFPLWCRQAAFVAERVRAERGESTLRVWGHSIGGAIALHLAATTPGVSHVIATGTAGGEQRLNPPLDKFWTFPASREQLREAMMSSMLNPADITDALVDDRYATLQLGDIGPYFGRMMSGDKQALLDSLRLPRELLARVSARVTLIHGRDDKPCPYEESVLPLLKKIPKCDAILLGQCGHNPAREQPARTVKMVIDRLLET